jgi:hypothetical protein
MPPNASKPGNLRARRELAYIEDLENYYFGLLADKDKQVRRWCPLFHLPS